MDSESQELIQEHIPQTEDYEETPSTKDNLPTEPEREDDRGAVSNLTFLNAGQVRRGIGTTSFPWLVFSFES
jgi:hypothetical protein